MESLRKYELMKFLLYFIIILQLGCDSIGTFSAEEEALSSGGFCVLSLLVMVG